MLCFSRRGVDPGQRVRPLKVTLVWCADCDSVDAEQSFRAHTAARPTQITQVILGVWVWEAILGKQPASAVQGRFTNTTRLNACGHRLSLDMQMNWKDTVKVDVIVDVAAVLRAVAAIILIVVT